MRATIFLASVVAFGASNAAAASPRQEPAQTAAVEVLPISDLNLASARDQKRLRTRIVSAATRLCSDAMSATSWVPPVEIECFHRSLGDALAQMQVLVARAGSGPVFAASSPSAIRVRRR